MIAGSPYLGYAVTAVATMSGRVRTPRVRPEAVGARFTRPAGAHSTTCGLAPGRAQRQVGDPSLRSVPGHGGAGSHRNMPPTRRSDTPGACASPSHLPDIPDRRRAGEQQASVSPHAHNAAPSHSGRCSACPRPFRASRQSPVASFPHQPSRASAVHHQTTVHTIATESSNLSTPHQPPRLTSPRGAIVDGPGAGRAVAVSDLSFAGGGTPATLDRDAPGWPTPVRPGHDCRASGRGVPGDKIAVEVPQPPEDRPEILR